MTNKEKSSRRIFLNNLVGTVRSFAICLPLIIMSELPCYFGEKINSQKKLDELVILESKKLGLNPSYIDAKLMDCNYSKEGVSIANPQSAHVSKLKKNNYEITLENVKTKRALRHELYHIYDDDFNADEKYNMFELLSNEIQANIYATTGIKTSLKHL